MPEALAREVRQVRLALAMLWLVPILWTANYVVARQAPPVPE